MTDVSVGEVARQVQAAMTRLEGLARKIEDSFVTYRVFDLHAQALHERVKALEKELEESVSKKYVETLEKRIANLEDDRKWVIRLVIGFIILGILSFYLASSGGVK